MRNFKFILKNIIKAMKQYYPSQYFIGVSFIVWVIESLFFKMHSYM